MVKIMNGSTLQIRSLSTLGQSWPRAKDTSKVRAHETQRVERSPFSLLSLVSSMLATTLYTLVSVMFAALATAAFVLVLPWLLLAPMIVTGLLISLAGFVLGGLGLI
jgi:hypothetical protein